MITRQHRQTGVRISFVTSSSDYHIWNNAIDTSHGQWLEKERRQLQN